MIGKVGTVTQAEDMRKSERRKHPRFIVRQDALLYNNDVLAEVVEISVGGVACRCFTHPEDEVLLMDDFGLLNCEAGQYVKGLSCRLVRSQDLSPEEQDGFGNMTAWFLEFKDLDTEQNEELARFITGCSKEYAGELVSH